MKILHLTTHLNTGGITTYILKLIAPFKERGIQTYVASSGGELESAFKDKGAVSYRLNIRTKSELHPKLYWAIPKIIQIIRDQQITALHAHTRVTQIIALVIQRLIKIPVITTCHGFYKPRWGRKLIPAWGDKAIAISDAVGSALEADFSVSSERVKVIYNAVDISELDRHFLAQNPAEIRRSYGIGPTDPVVGVVARLVADKGHEFLIRAIAQLKKEFPSLKALIVGDGRCKRDLELLAQNLGLANDIIFTGNVEDVTRPLAAMDIFALPATWREGFGLSIVEAMTCRKPVVVTNIWALNTLIQDGVTGIMIEPKKIEPLAAAIRRYLKNPELAAQLSANGRKMAEELFSIDRMADEIADVYRQIAPAILSR